MPPRSIENIMASHDAAQTRRQQGRPIWDVTLYLGDVFHNEDLTFEEKRDEIVQRIQNSGWLEATDSDTFAELVEELGDTDDVEEFDQVWDLIYDQANLDRVWIETVGRR